MNWMDDATCTTTNPDMFFSEHPDVLAQAANICTTCPVMDMCREYADDNKIRDGVWGGASPRVRAVERGVTW
jgi:WhiB family redox-sensing transcriptional regulator